MDDISVMYHWTLFESMSLNLLQLLDTHKINVQSFTLHCHNNYKSFGGPVSPTFCSFNSFGACTVSLYYLVFTLRPPGWQGIAEVVVVVMRAPSF